MRITKKLLRQSLFVAGAFCAVTTGMCADGEPEQKRKLTREELSSEAFIDKLSQAYGHLIQKSLNNPVLKLNMDEVIKGMQDSSRGVASPMTDEEYEEAIGSIQEKAFQDMSAKNLQEADDFLRDNAEKPGVIVLEPGKLQYIVEQKGNGKTLTEDDVAEITYKGRYANGQIFGSSEEAGGPVSLVLKQTIPGFRKGLTGMQEGEKRKLFIHPELGYGVSGQLMPNALLIFEVELVKVKDKKDDKDSLVGVSDDDSDDSEDIDPNDGHPEPQEDEEDYEDHDVNVDMNK